MVRELYYTDTTAIYDSEGSREHLRGGYGIRGGLDWFISKNDVLGLSFYYGTRSSQSNSGNTYNIGYMDPLQGTPYDTEFYNSYDISERGGGRSGANLDYTHKFNDTNGKANASGDKRSGNGANGASRVHQIKINTSYYRWNSDEFSYTYLENAAGDTTEGQKTEERGPSNSIRTEVEYMLPLGENNMFEAGFNGRFNWKEDKNNVYYLNTGTGAFDLQDDFSYLARSKQNRISFYSLFSGEIGRFGFQPGLRAEYTYREINSSAQDSAFVLDRLHLFPTLHASYQLPADIQLMASYTRRISRPRGWQLEPFYTWWDAYNIRIGNPDLVPEMSDSYDFSVQKRFGKSFVSLDAYYKKTHDKIERIQTVYSGDVILNTYENVGQDRSLGMELSGNLNLYKWWMLNLSTSLYHYRVSGELYGEDFHETSTNYGGRLRNTFVIKENTRFQFGLHYRSRSATAQGTRSGGLMTDLALRQEFFNDKLSATLQVRDIFGTGKYERVVSTPDYKTTSVFERQSPMISLNLSLKINNYRDKKQRGGEGFDDEGFDIDGGEEF
ncbi:MAG: outer membrane beta-barrel family protein [Candidatus Marinimicrobia bacterium]|nr:outer membrane beta-barrel family protein [Candidatus Neomarinimicrobiota bacterium]